jgi:hypothetical protein
MQKGFIKRESTLGFISLQRLTNPSWVFQEKRVYQGVEHVDKRIFQLQTLFEGLLFSEIFYLCTMLDIASTDFIHQD